MLGGFENFKIDVLRLHFGQFQYNTDKTDKLYDNNGYINFQYCYTSAQVKC